MNTKNILAVLLALVMCIGILAACSTQPQETTQSTTKATEGTTAATTAPTETTEAAPLKNVDIYPISSDHTFTLLTTNSAAAEAHNWNLFVDAVGLDVEWQVASAEQVPLLLLDKENLPDIYFRANGLSTAQINEYGANGVFINYADYLDLMPNLQRWIDAYPNFLDPVIQEDGSFYFLPGYVTSLTAPGNLFYVRTDMTREAGWEELPTTIEDFLKMCEDLKTYYADVEGYEPMVCNGEASIAYNGAYAQFFFPAFGELMRPDITTNADWTKIEVGFATEQYKNYITFMHTLYENGYMDDDCFVADSATNKARLIEKSTTMNPYATYLTPENFESGEMDFQAMPPMSSQYQSEARWANFYKFNSQTLMITTACEDIEAAVRFMDAFYAPEDDPLDEEGHWAITVWLGEEGVDFTRNEEEGWYVINDHEGYDSGSAWVNAQGTTWSVICDWPYYENGGTGLMIKAKSVRDVLSPNGIDIFYPTSLLTLTQDEQDIYNDCWTSIEAKVAEMNAAFITGQKDIDAEWDNYISTLYDIGLQDVIDVYQAALDRYNAR